MTSNPQVWQDLASGEISESYRIDGSGIVFNLEGLPFSLPEFMLVLRRQAQQVLALSLVAPGLDPINLLQIGALIPLPASAAEIRRARAADLSLGLKPELVEQCLAPAYAGLGHLDELLRLRDGSGGHLLLDFYNYEFLDLELLL